MQDLHDRQQHIETDQIGQRQRTYWVIAAELHPLVDLPRAGVAFSEYEERFVDHRQQKPVDDETGAILDGDG